MSADKKQGGFGQYLRSSSTPCFNFSPEISFAKDRIGAFSLDDALAERKRKDATRYQWASIHALSPGLYNEFQARLKGGKDYERHDLAAQFLMAGCTMNTGVEKKRSFAPNRRLTLLIVMSGPGPYLQFSKRISFDTYPEANKSRASGVSNLSLKISDVIAP
jgi:hypothetical protein